MPLWILSLPPGCDNLLELPMFDFDCSCITSDNVNSVNDDNYRQSGTISMTVKRNKQVSSPLLFPRQ